MKLSTRTTYGLRAMAVLALGYGSGPVLLKEIVQRQRLPATYLEQLMVPLRKSGLVSATRGVHGGYMLARPPGEITLAQVIQVLEGPLDLLECASVSSCHLRPEACALRDILTEASRRLTGYFEEITLAELARRQVEKDSQPTHMYAI